MSASLCPTCAAPVASDSKFCGECGAALALGASRASASAFGVSKSQRPPTNEGSGHAVLGAELRTKAPPTNRTIMGGPGLSAEVFEAAARARQADSAFPAPMATSRLEGAAPAGETPAAEPAPKSRPGPTNQPKRTMVGVPAAQLTESATGAVTGDAAERPEPKPAPALAPQTHRTMLGMVTPLASTAESTAGGAAEGTPASPSPAAAPAPESDPAAPVSKAFSSPSDGAGRGELADENETRPARVLPTTRRSDEFEAAISEHPSFSRASVPTTTRLGLPIWVTGGALVSLGVVVMALAYLLMGRGPQLRATVETTQRGDALVLEVPDAAPGSKLRFRGKTVALEGARATFALATDGLVVGDNELAVDVIAPDGSVRSSSLTLKVEFRVRANLAGIDREPPYYEVVVDALPGAKVTIAEESVPLDGTGRGTLRFGIPPQPSEGNTYDHEVSYRVVPPDGAARDGRVQTRIPYASLQIDRPGRQQLTEGSSIELSGVTHAEASLQLDGQPLSQREGRFVKTLSLPEVGAYEFAVTASQPGHATRTTRLNVERVSSLAQAARSFDADKTLTYAKVHENPETYRGRKVAMTGRAYHVEVAAGRTVLQMLVKDCPRGERCPLWVVAEGVTSATKESWVRVLGTLAGEQRFRSQAGREVSVPRVDAQFVLAEDE